MSDERSTYYISIASPKGGTGKTMTTILLACEFAEAGYQVLVIDADIQASAMGWFQASKRAKFPLKNIAVESIVDKERIMDRIQAIATNKEPYDVVLFDVQGTAEGTVGYTVQNSDLMIIPTRMHKFDVDQAISLVKYIKGIAGRGRVTPHRILVNAVNAIERNNAGFKTAELLLEQSGAPRLPATLSLRPTFATVATAGSLYEVANPNKAVLEARNASREFFNAVVEALNEV